MQAVVASRGLVSVALAAMVGLALISRLPFPDENNLLQFVRLNTPIVFYGIKWTYLAMLFTTPYIGVSLLLSLAYIFIGRKAAPVVGGKLPPYPEPAMREKLFLVIGELHHPRRPEPVEDPRWLVIADRGLFTGLAVFGAVGSGKTSGVILPAVEQLLSYKAHDPGRRIGGLVLEVKGDLCRRLHAILVNVDRVDDYIEVNLEGEWRYNPLHNDQDAYASAFGIASLLNNLFGRGKEPFWQQAYTNLVKFIILLHKVLYDYVTLFDVYECAINPKLLEQKIEEGERRFSGEYLSIEVEAFQEHPALDEYAFVLDKKAKRLKAPHSRALRSYLESSGIPYVSQTENGQVVDGVACDEKKYHQFEAVKRWFYQDWARIQPKLRTSIIEGISVFLSLFDDNPDVKRVFCPPKAAYDVQANKDRRYGTPLPPWRDLFGSGSVLTLNFPVSLNPGLARTIG